MPVLPAGILGAATGAAGDVGEVSGGGEPRAPLRDRGPRPLLVNTPPLVLAPIAPNFLLFRARLYVRFLPFGDFASGRLVASLGLFRAFGEPLAELSDVSDLPLLFEEGLFADRSERSERAGRVGGAGCARRGRLGGRGTRALALAMALAVCARAPVDELGRLRDAGLKLKLNDLKTMKKAHNGCT